MLNVSIKFNLVTHVHTNQDYEAEQRKIETEGQLTELMDREGSTYAQVPEKKALMAQGQNS